MNAITSPAAFPAAGFAPLDWQAAAERRDDAGGKG